MARKGGNNLTGMQTGNWYADMVVTDPSGNISVNVNADPAELLKRDANAAGKYEDKIMKGVYFEKWVWDAIEDLAEDIGKGGKSNLINLTMKQYLRTKGYAEKITREELAQLNQEAAEEEEEGKQHEEAGN